jgi:hypothetical protein
LHLLDLENLSRRLVLERLLVLLNLLHLLALADQLLPEKQVKTN